MGLLDDQDVPPEEVLPVPFQFLISTVPNGDGDDVPALLLHLQTEHRSEEKVKQVLLLLVLLLDGLLAPLKPNKLPNNQNLLAPGFVQRLRGTVQLPGGQTPENVTWNLHGCRFF